jgi:outer membrane immunogenic protein
MKRAFLVSVSALALVGQAAAADLPRPGPAYPVKAPPPVMLYGWTGFYIGVNGGGAWGRSSWDTTDTFDIDGGLVGGTIGYNFQVGPAVWGIEGDIDWTNIKGSTTTLCPLGCETSNSWLATVRGRLGYAGNRWMPYVTGGAAFGDIRASTPGFAGNSANKAGWTVGGGLEFALFGNWTAKAEYLYVDLGNFNCGLGCGVATTDNVSFTANIVRGGINYRF